MTCEKAIQKTSSWGKGRKVKCGKSATMAIGELPVCVYCYNKWKNKQARTKLRKETGLTNSELNQMGLINNHGNIIQSK